MCREKCSPKCFIDHMLLTMIVILLMLFYMYMATKNTGIISILLVIFIFFFVVFTIRLEDYGCPDFIHQFSNICKDRLIHDDEDDNEPN